MLHVEGFLTAVRAMINAGHRLAQERHTAASNPRRLRELYRQRTAQGAIEGQVIPVAEGLSVDALGLMHGAEQIGFEGFYYQMKGGWDIERCLLARLLLVPE